jgi:hypothetical protein
VAAGWKPGITGDQRPITNLLALTVYFCSTGGVTGPEPGEAPVELQLVAASLAFPLYVTSPPRFGQTSSSRSAARSASCGTACSSGCARPARAGDDRQRAGTAGHGVSPAGWRVVVTSPGRRDLGRAPRISTFTASANPDVLDPASERVILEVDQPYSSHNGGHVAFELTGSHRLRRRRSGSDPEARRDQTDLRVPSSGSTSTTRRRTIPSRTPSPVIGEAEGLWNWGLRIRGVQLRRTLGSLYMRTWGGRRAKRWMSSPNSAGGRTTAGPWRADVLSVAGVPPSG